MSIEGINTRPFIYKIGDIVETNSGSVTIIDMYRGKIMPSQKWNNKIVKFKCNKCGLIDKKVEGVLQKGSGCKVCGGSRIVSGFNDIATLHPEYVHIFYNPEDAKKYSLHSDKKADLKCECCGAKIPQVTITTIETKGIILCPLCKDKTLSLGEKIMWAILNYLKIDFIYDNTTEFSNGRRYDFYIPKNNLIIEMDGMQHSIKPFCINGHVSKTIEEIQKIDQIKEELAIKNGIQHYIHIDTKEGNYNLIIERIQNQLKDLLPLSKVNWGEIRKETIKPIGKRCLDLWNNGIKSTVDISKQLNINIDSVRKCLKQYASIDMCDYDPYDARRLVHKPPEKREYTTIKAVICLNNLFIFDRMVWASRWCGTKQVVNNCKGRRQHAGWHPETGEQLQWQYLEEYYQCHPEIKDREIFYKEHVQQPIPRGNKKF